MANIKDKIASALGSVLEWYDFALYGFFAHTIAKLYFPSVSPSIGLLKTFSIFAIGFFARPIGALLFGYVGDKFGRSVNLKITPLLITIPTVVFSILPTYQNIGVIAPIIFIVLRIWQGICIGSVLEGNIQAILFICVSHLDLIEFIFLVALVLVVLVLVFYWLLLLQRSVTTFSHITT